MKYNMINFVKSFREMNFKGKSYKAAYLNDENHGTWHVFNDEVSVRETLWNINEGDIVLDIGAGSGSYALPALASGAGYVYVWTPQGDASLAVNEWVNRCTVYDFGLYHKSGFLQIEPQLQLYEQEPSGYDDNIIPVTTLNLWLSTVELTKIDMIKLDVEAAEVEILIGGSDLINKFRPTIMIENHIFKRPNVCEEIKTVLEPYKYKEICNIPYLRPGWPNISHSIWIPDERETPNKIYPEAHFC